MVKTMKFNYLNKISIEAIFSTGCSLITSYTGSNFISKQKYPIFNQIILVFILFVLTYFVSLLFFKICYWTLNQIFVALPRKNTIAEKKHFVNLFYTEVLNEVEILLDLETKLNNIEHDEEKNICCYKLIYKLYGNFQILQNLYKNKEYCINSGTSIYGVDKKIFLTVVLYMRKIIINLKDNFSSNFDSANVWLNEIQHGLEKMEKTL